MDLREFFHLVFLRQLSQRLSGRRWAVKGGICLRFFHRSPRMSEDLDLDIEPRIGMDALRNAVETSLEGRPTSSALAAKGISGVRATAPKQTRTVQRWKVALLTGGTNPLGTRIEVSRRREDPPFVAGTPGAEILERHALTPFMAHFYGPAEMASQKIAALASPTRTARRDLFDLDHLFTTLMVKPGDLNADRIRGDAATAADKAGGFTYASFREEVLPFLDESMMGLYAHGPAFDALKDRVVAILTRLTG